MNKIVILSVAGLSWLFALDNVHAQEDYVYYEAGPQTFSFSGTIKYAAPGTFEVNPETNKYDKTMPAFESTLDTTNKVGNITKSVFTSSAIVKTLKYDNAVLLKEIKDDLLDGTTSGWSLVVYIDGESGSSQIIARKKAGTEFNEVSLGSINPAGGVNSGTYTETTSYTFDSEGSPSGSTVTMSGKYAYEGAVECDINGTPFLASVTETGADYVWYPDKNDKSFQDSIYLSAGGKITGGVGYVNYQDPDTGDSYEGVFLGTGSLGKASAVKSVSP